MPTDETFGERPVLSKSADGEVVSAKPSSTSSTKSKRRRAKRLSPAHHAGERRALHENGAVPMSHRWKASISAYPVEDRVALEFASDKEIDRAIDVCFDDKALAGVPVSFADGMTLVLPREASQLLRDRGLNFTELELISSAGLNEDEMRAFLAARP